jgi:hypothetical protein
VKDNVAYIHEKTGNLMTPKCRMAWSSLLAPSRMKNDDGEAKHDVTILIPKDADITVLKKAATEAAEEKFGVKAKTLTLRSPFRKTEGKDSLADLAEDFPFYITARSKDRPGVVGPNGKAVDDPEQIYPGRWVRASIQAFGYDTKGNKGVSFGLQNVQLLDHDDPLAIGGSRVSAEAEFDAVEGAGDETKSSDALFE